MSRHLLLVTIGPVQDFIAQARRTRDLWYGSHLLSELSRTVASTLAGSGAKLIFPALPAGDPEMENCLSPIRQTGLHAGKQPLNIANKILAEVPEGTVPRTIARTAREALGKYWSDAIAGGVKGKCHDLIVQGLALDAAWTEQIDTLIEFSAACAPIGDTQDGYKTARDQVEKAIAARKNLRDFEAWTKQRGNTPKSSLDGGRETVLRSPDKRNETLARKYRIAKSEQLDAVGLVKRAGGEPDQFVPVVNVALASWTTLAARTVGIRDELGKLRDQCAPKKLARVDRKDLPCAAHFPFDASILLPSRWRPTFEEQGLGTPEEADRFGADHVRPLLAKLGEPSPYVASIVADGDHMGGAIDLMTDAEAHRGFSRNLAQFAGTARHIVEQQHSGSLVYSGGDDVLAFLPVPEALACAEALRQAFAKIMETACLSIKDKKGYKQPTLSVGIGIGHIMEGMGDLLDLGRKAEKLAKGGDLPKVEDRNALAIILDKRSGGTRSWRAQWDNDPAGRLRSDAEAFGTTLSTRKVYEIARTLARLPDAKAVTEAEQEDWARLLRKEVFRSLARMDAGGGSVGAQKATDVADRLGLRLDESAVSGDYGKMHQVVTSWVDRVLIASVIAEAQPRVRHRTKGEAA